MKQLKRIYNEYTQLAKYKNEIIVEKYAEINSNVTRKIIIYLGIYLL